MNLSPITYITPSVSCWQGFVPPSCAQASSIPEGNRQNRMYGPERLDGSKEPESGRTGKAVGSSVFQGNPTDRVSARMGAKGEKEQGEEPVRWNLMDEYQCQTCKNRTYQDGSDDPGVSFKNPAAIDPQVAAGIIRGHEMEHVYRERFQAEKEDRRVVSQSVTLHMGICPECGKAYVSGGTTRTVTKGEAQRLFSAGTQVGNAAGTGFSAIA